jgi:thioredoxin 2
MSDSVVRACPACGTKNRVPVRRLADTGRCGRCKAALPPVDHPVDADPALFDAVLRSVAVPVLVDFWAPWCGPCRVAEPLVKNVAKKKAGRAVVLKVNTDQHPELGARYQVQGIPNFVVLKGGRVVSQRPGLVRQQDMEEWLDAAAVQAAPAQPAA